MAMTADSSRPPCRLWLAVLVLSFSSGFHFGFHLVITNPAQEAFITWLHKCINVEGEEPVMDRPALENLWSMYVSVMFAGALVGAFFIQIMADRLGRRISTIVTNIGQIACCLMAIAAYFASCHPLFGASRFFLGFFQAISVGIVPMYISEFSPASVRGVISLSTALFCQISIVIASIVAMSKLLGTLELWWTMFAAEVVILVVATIALLFMPESPAYLLAKGFDAAASKSVSYYHGVRDFALNKAMSEMRKEAGSAPTALGPFALLKDASQRKPAFIGSVVMFGMIASGVVVINAYAVGILKDVGLSDDAAAWGNVGICAVMVVGCLVSSLFIDRFGRRPLLLSTMAVIIALNLLVVLFLFLFEEFRENIFGYALLATICAFAFIFCIGPCPIAFFISAELCDQHARGAAMLWASVVLAGVRAIVLLVFPPLKHNIGAPLTYFLLFVPLHIAAYIFLYRKLPETKNGAAPTKAVTKEEEESFVVQ